MTPTPTQQAVYTPTAQEIYDMIMGAIEPELLSDMLPALDLLYVNETVEEKEARLAWYDIAFETYDARYTKFMEGWKNYYTDIRKQAARIARTAEERGSQTDTSFIEDSLQNS